MQKYRIIEEDHPAYGRVYKVQKESRFFWMKSWHTITKTDHCIDGLEVTEDKMFDHSIKAELFIRKLEVPKEKPITVIKEIII